MPDGNQLMMERLFDNEDELFVITAKAHISNMCATTTLSFDSEETRDENFDNMLQETAEDIYKAIKEILSPSSTPAQS
jgi:hypothetical protein